MAIIYLDFHKAFDVVSHTKLMLRLSHYSIRGSVLSWLKNVFTGRTHQTKIDNILSDSVNLVSGVVTAGFPNPLDTLHLFLVGFSVYTCV